MLLYPTDPIPIFYSALIKVTLFRDVSSARQISGTRFWIPGVRDRLLFEVERHVTDVGRQGYPYGPEDCAGRSFGLRAQDKAFSCVLQLYFGEIVQVELDVGPLA